MEPTPPAGPPPEPEAARPGAAFVFFLALFVLVLPDALAQASSQTFGLAWSELFTLLLPTLVATAGSNLRVARYLGLDRARPAPIALGALLGGAGFLAANGVMTLWVMVLPRQVLDEFPDVARIFEGPVALQVVISTVAVGLAPVCEEIAFRGYLQRTLARAMGPGRAVAVTALLFAVRHLDPVRFPALLLLGAIFGWAAWRSGSIWPAVAAHAANNGLATALALAAGGGNASTARPSAADALWPLAVGGAALALLAVLYRRVTPAPPAPQEAVALRDPADPSTRFRPDRLPPSLVLAALVGLVALSTLTLLSPLWSRGAGP